MEVLRFSYNWNNKLDCKAFTTIRISDRFKVGQEYDIQLREKIDYVSKGAAKILEIREFKLEQMNEFVARIDTGYSEQECKDILTKMYKNKSINWETQIIYLILFAYNQKPEKK